MHYEQDGFIVVITLKRDICLKIFFSISYSFQNLFLKEFVFFQKFKK